MGLWSSRHQPAVGSVRKVLRRRCGSRFADHDNSGVFFRVDPEFRLELGKERLGDLCVGRIRVHDLPGIVQSCLGMIATPLIVTRVGAGNSFGPRPLKVSCNVPDCDSLSASKLSFPIIAFSTFKRRLKRGNARPSWQKGSHRLFAMPKNLCLCGE